MCCKVSEVEKMVNYDELLKIVFKVVTEIPPAYWTTP